MMFVQFIQAAVVLFLNLCFARCTLLHQPDSVITADLGANVTLQCLFPENYSIYDMFWYKQMKGEPPRAVVTVSAVADPIFHTGNIRFNISRSKKRLSLSVSNVGQWDEAVYYCGVEIFFDIEFGNGVYLALKASSFTALNPAERYYLIKFIISLCNITGICAVWVIYLCIGLRQQNVPSPDRISVHIEIPEAKGHTSSANQSQKESTI